jgi:Zn-dependent peptidase ImmA (M78 family)/transcriptional regulator with XRE-family HTH domain
MLVETPEELGRRVALARAESKLSREAVATEVRVLSPVAIAEIEAGSRPVDAWELALLGRALGRRPDWFLEESPEAVVSRRSGPHGRRDLDPLIESVARDTAFLVGISRLSVAAVRAARYRFPTTQEEIERCADETRRAAGAQEGPIRDLVRTAESLDLFVFALECPPDFDAAYVSVGSYGVAIVNGRRDPGRRRFSLAHEIGHHVFDDQYIVDWASLDTPTARERTIDGFAAALLMPQVKLRSDWIELSQRVGPQTAAVVLSSWYRVSMSAFASRLVTLKLISSREFATIASRRSTRDDFSRSMDGAFAPFVFVPHDDLRAVTLSPRYEDGVVAAYRANEIAAARALELLYGAAGATRVTPVSRGTDTLWNDVPW